jgi:WD40 repeat protein
MFRFDLTLVQPAHESLEQVLAAAGKAADLAGRGRLLRWPPPSLAAFFARYRGDRDGSWQWNGGEDAPPPAPRPCRRRGRGHGRVPRDPDVRGRPGFPVPGRREPRLTHEQRQRERRSVVAVAWWSDWIGRRHVRVIGCQRQAVEPPEALLRPGPSQPAVAVVYPEQAFRLSRRGRTEVLVACPCGVFGSTREVGWMGDCCGPCHDHRESAGREHAARLLARAGAPVTSLAFSADGRRLACGCLDGTLLAWDVPAGRQCLGLRVQGGEHCWHARLSPDGSAVAALTGDAAISVWDVATGACRQVKAGGQLRSLEYLPDGRLIALSPWGVSVWDPESGLCEARLTAERGRTFDLVTASAAGIPLVVGLGNDDLTFQDVMRGRERARLRWPGTEPPGGEEPLLSVPGPVLAASADGRTLAVAVNSWGGQGSFVGLWDQARGEVRPVARGWPPAAALFSPDGRTLVTLANPGGSVQSWDVATGEELATLQEYSRGVSCAALSPDGRLLATGNAEGGVKLWPAEMLRP